MRPKNMIPHAGAGLARTVLLLCVAAAGATAWGQARPDVKEPVEVPTLQANYNGTSLDDVMKEYGEMTGLTPLIHPAIAARRVTITWQSRTKLTKKQYLEGMLIMLTYNGVALVPYGKKFVKVVAIDAARGSAIETQILPPEGPVEDTDAVISRVISFKHMEIAEANKVIEALKSVNGKVQPLDRINSVLLTDSAANINRILEMLEHIDQPIETKEQFFILPIRYMKASEIKTRLDDLIRDLMDKAPATPQVAKPAAAGPPIMVPGLIRAPRAGVPSMPGETATGFDSDVEKGLVRGKVKIVADDRTGILIFITLPANMKFFEQVVQALDKDVKVIPDVLVKVYRMEFADANDVATMINTLIGAVTKKDAAATAAAAVPKTQPQGGAAPTPQGVSTLEEYVAERPAVEEIQAGLSPARKSKLGELAADNIKILPDKRTNGLIVMASKSDQETIAELIKEMDMMLSQVLIEAVIIEVTLDDKFSTGVQWLQNAMIVYDQKNGRRSPVGSFTGSGGGGVPTPLDATGVSAPSTAGLTYYFTHYGLNVNAAVQMASSDGRTKVLSTPVILTTDNTEATLKVTEQIYVNAGSLYYQGANTPVANWQTKDVGLELKVKPHINTNKVVMMEISQSMSDPGGEASDDKIKSGMTVSSTRSLNASIAVKDKETIILGGQVWERSDNTRSKVPFLGDLPFVGRLFNSSSKTGKRKEMIVLITPYVLDTPGAIAAESLRRKRALDLQGIWKRGDKEWSDSKLAEPTTEQKRLDAREAKERARAEKAEAARIAAEEDKTAAGEGKATVEADKKAAAEERKAAAQKATPKINPVLLEMMSRHQAEWGESIKEVDRTNAPVGAAGE